MVVLKLNDVAQRVALRKSSIYALVKRGEFPAPLHLTDSAVGWLESEIDQWIANRPRGVRQGARK